MKKIFITLFSLVAFSLSAQNTSAFHVAIGTGLDIGAAVPWPISKAVGGGDKMRATPHLTPAISVVGEYELNPKWSINVETTYKTVSLDADIITLNHGQKFKDNELDVLFFGRASTSMSFSMLEVPLYAKFKINHKHSVFLGGYYAYIIKGKFEATAQQGWIEDASGAISLINPDKPLDQDFGPNLSKWDAGWQAGYAYQISKNLFLAGRYSMGLKNIFKHGENYLEYGMLHMRGTISVIYRLY